MKNDLLIQPKECAERLGVGRNAMYNMIKEKDFPCMYIGKKIYINVELLEEWLKKQCSKKK